MEKQKGIPKTPTDWPNWPLERVMLFLMVACTAIVGIFLYKFFSLDFDLNQNFSNDPANWGQVGDYFGGLLNPVISGCTLIVALAVWRLQKSELAATKLELQTQRGQQRFFDLLNIYYRTLDSISSSYIRPISRQNPDFMRSLASGKGLSSGLPFYEEVGSESIYLSGKAALSNLRRNIENRGSEPADDELNWWGNFRKAVSTNKEDRAFGKQLLESEWENIQCELGIEHFFRTATLILREAEQLLGEEHWRYVAIFTAQLSDDELTLIAYKIWLTVDGEDLLKVAKKYGLLQHMSARREEFESCLPKSLFSRPDVKI